MQGIIEYLKQLGTDVGLKIIFGILVLFIGFKIACLKTANLPQSPFSFVG